MSTDWDVYCLDCRQQAGLDDLAARLYRVIDLSRVAPLLAELSKAKIHAHLCLDGPSAYVPIEFFEQHEGHRLVPINEYGEHRET